MDACTERAEAIQNILSGRRRVRENARITRVFCARATRTFYYSTHLFQARVLTMKNFTSYTTAVRSADKKSQRAPCVSHSDNEVYHRMHKFHFKLHFTRKQLLFFRCYMEEMSGTDLKYCYRYFFTAKIKIQVALPIKYTFWLLKLI